MGGVHEHALFCLLEYLRDIDQAPARSRNDEQIAATYTSCWALTLRSSSTVSG
ncbi:hypothetical protein [Schaalia odontolytica]|uniref:hypothetical protein n=1 Tax=Schaalia odontolytica TaxID=1660 RepID=UPI001D096DF2|nr:hypothetical protein [Schaalia odontolytica]MCB6402951.1 hypothetical protein [Schaalia odontolytica]